MNMSDEAINPFIELLEDIARHANNSANNANNFKNTPTPDLEALAAEYTANLTRIAAESAADLAEFKAQAQAAQNLITSNSQLAQSYRNMTESFALIAAELKNQTNQTWKANFARASAATVMLAEKALASKPGLFSGISGIAKLGSVLNRIGDIADEGLLEFADGLGGIAMEIGAAGLKLGAEVGDGLKSVGKSIGNDFKGLGNSISKGVTSSVNKVGGTFTKLGNKIANDVVKATNKVGNGVKKAYSKTAKFATKAAGKVAGLAVQLYKFVKKAATSLWGMLGTFARALLIGALLFGLFVGVKVLKPMIASAMAKRAANYPLTQARLMETAHEFNGEISQVELDRLTLMLDKLAGMGIVATAHPMPPTATGVRSRGGAPIHSTSVLAKKAREIKVRLAQPTELELWWRKMSGIETQYDQVQNGDEELEDMEVDFVEKEEEDDQLSDDRYLSDEEDEKEVHYTGPKTGRLYDIERKTPLRYTDESDTSDQ